MALVVSLLLALLAAAAAAADPALVHGVTDFLPEETIAALLRESALFVRGLTIQSVGRDSSG